MLPERPLGLWPGDLELGGDEVDVGLLDRHLGQLALAGGLLRGLGRLPVAYILGEMYNIPVQLENTISICSFSRKQAAILVPGWSKVRRIRQIALLQHAQNTLFQNIDGFADCAMLLGTWASEG